MDIQHEPEVGRFYAPIGEREENLAPIEDANWGMTLRYRTVSDDVVDFRSTLVPPHLRGRGLGSELVQHALDWARESDVKVIPSCPFVSRFLEDHPEYQDLVYDGE